MASNPPKPGKIRFSINLPEEVKNQIKERADKECTSVAAILIRAIRRQEFMLNTQEEGGVWVVDFPNSPERIVMFE